MKSIETRNSEFTNRLTAISLRYIFSTTDYFNCQGKKINVGLQNLYCISLHTHTHTQTKTKKGFFETFLQS